MSLLIGNGYESVPLTGRQGYTARMSLLNPIFWGAVLVATLIIGEVARAVVNKRRVAHRGIGGTQDIAIMQTAAACFAIAMFVVSLCYRFFW